MNLTGNIGLFIFLLVLTIRCNIKYPSPEDVVVEIKARLESKESTFRFLIDTLSLIKSHSFDWELEYYPKRGIRFYSYTPFERYGISFSEYKRLYYNDYDTLTSPNYVEDFRIPSNLALLLEQIDVQRIRVIRDTTGILEGISFYFKSELFPPIARVVFM